MRRPFVALFITTALIIAATWGASAHRSPQAPGGVNLPMQVGMGDQRSPPAVTNAPASAFGRRGSIRGQIIGAKDQAASLVLVQLLWGDGRVVNDVTAQVNGWYHFPNLPAGRYGLRVFSENGRPLAMQAGHRVEIEADDGDTTVQNDLLLADSSQMARSELLAPMAATGQISGVVTAADTGLPYQYVEVAAYMLDGTYWAGTTTKASGAYTITGLLPGTYKVQFYPYSNLHAPEWYNDQASFSSATIVTVSAGSVVSGANAALEVGGRITGTITAVDGGMPIASAYVSVYDSDGLSGAFSTVEVSGDYYTSALRNGNYRVRFRPINAAAEKYLSEYYNNKPDLASADAVTVVAPLTTSGVNAALETGGRITGTITRAGTGEPIGGAQVSVYNCLGQVVSSNTTDFSGTYSTAALPTGSYRLVANGPAPYGVSNEIPQYYNGKSNLQAADIVSVTTPDTTSGVDFQLERGGQIAGHITADDGGAPLQSARVSAYDSTGRFVVSAIAVATGEYTLAPLPTGNYRVRFRGSSGSTYLTEYYNDQTTLSAADLISVTAPNIVNGIDAALARGGQIVGRVTALDTGNPLPASALVFNDTGVSLASGNTNANGWYTTTGVLTGSYRVLFSPSTAGLGESRAYGRQWYHDKPSFTIGDVVTVTAAGPTSGIDAALKPGGRITGRVMALDGKPIPAPVDVYVYDDDGIQVGYGFTDVRGSYFVLGLATGNYRVQFDSSVVPSRCAGLLAAQYYDNKPDLASADFVAVTAPSATEHINAILWIAELGERLFLPLLRR